ncbi:MAG: hypothetical protein GXO30_03885 [Epsilonproteobacteria bacterium]|nr:hypothetical protein [Campylobacterota bacterium]
MQKDIFDKIINFLLGASWAIVIFGALITFKIFLFLGFPIALFFTIIFVILALFVILAIDTFAVNKERLQEAKKHTQLLEELLQKP